MEDKSLFARWLEDQVARAGGPRAAARQSGVSHSTLIKAMKGESIRLDTLKAIAEWRKQPLARMLEMYGEDIGERRTEMELERIAEKYPELRDTLNVAVEVLDDEGIAEVLRFIQYQVQRKRG
jgi:transcriptional regulator with XRE-family HTH domain